MIVIISLAAGAIIIDILVPVVVTVVPVAVRQSSPPPSIGAESDGRRLRGNLPRVENMTPLDTRVQGAARIGFGRAVLLPAGFVFAFAISSFDTGQ